MIREPGYDGEYGVIRLFEDGELKRRTASGFLFEGPAQQKQEYSRCDKFVSLPNAIRTPAEDSLTEPRAPSPLPACGERSDRVSDPGEGRYPQTSSWRLPLTASKTRVNALGGGDLSPQAGRGDGARGTRTDSYEPTGS